MATPAITKIPCYLAEKLGTKICGGALRNFVHASRNLKKKIFLSSLVEKAGTVNWSTY
jgi:hypothetical protein